MAPQEKKDERRPRAAEPGGLLTEDHTEIKLVSDEDRAWWSRLGPSAKIKFAERWRKKWTDEETQQLILARPDETDYYRLAEAMGRAPGALRWRRSQMIHILRDEYGYKEKALAYLKERKVHHKWADIGQVYQNL